MNKDINKVISNNHKTDNNQRLSNSSTNRIEADETTAVTSSSSSAMHLKFGDITPYPYLNQPFEVQVFLLDGETLKCGIEIQVAVELMMENDKLDTKTIQERLYQVPRHLYQLEPSVVTLGRNGIATITVCINELSMSFENRKMYLAARIETSTLSPSLSSLSLVRSALSKSMKCVRHRLVVRAEHDGESPDVWYKVIIIIIATFINIIMINSCIFIKFTVYGRMKVAKKIVSRYMCSCATRTGN
jgi:hypothetical protein